MATKEFTHNDYFSASVTRQADLKYLRKNKGSIIFSIYCAGVAVECMFRAYITKYTREFDSKHNLQKLYEKSQIATLLEQEEKEQILNAVKVATRLWKNELRYTSEQRMQRIIAHEAVNRKTNFKDINKYLNNLHSDFFSATELIIKTGQSKWT